MIRFLRFSSFELAYSQTINNHAFKTAQ